MIAAAAEIVFSLCIYSVYAAAHNNRQTVALCLHAVMTGSAAGEKKGFVSSADRVRLTPVPSGLYWVKPTVRVVPSASGAKCLLREPVQFDFAPLFRR